MSRIIIFLTFVSLFIVIESVPFLGGLSSLGESVPGFKNVKKLGGKLPIDQIKKNVQIDQLKKNLPIKDIKKSMPIKDPTKMLSKEAIDKTPLKAMGVDTRYLEKGGAAAKMVDGKVKKNMKNFDLDMDDDDDNENDDKKEENDDDDDDD